jgi:L-alanine-DL-glutamate epimerase-like enolase superfamily enzyme
LAAGTGHDGGDASGDTIEETVERVAAYVARGYKAVRAQTSVPGFSKIYGVSPGEALEYMPHSAETDRVFPHSYSFGDGMMHPGDAPGLGVEIDETLAATFPYQRAYLPVAKLMDGTMHSW